MNLSKSYRAELAQERLGLRLASYLSQSVDELPYETTERLRVARFRALVAHRPHMLARGLLLNPAASGQQVVSTGAQSGYWGGRWLQLLSWMPLLALTLGLVLINHIQNDRRAQEVAEVDSAILTDDLPPAAYIDSGFVAFLRGSPEFVNQVD